MIRSTFQFLQGMGTTWEERLWHRGIHDWHDFRSHSIEGISAKRKNRLDCQIKQASLALIEGNSSFFCGRLPTRENWRLYEHFKDEAIYLDIETSGLGGSQITVIGLFDGRDSRQLVRGINLERRTLERHLHDAKILVTFNGASFDLPFIERCFPGSLPGVPHIDLMPLSLRCGLAGGLKAIERKIGIARRDDIARLHGGDALSLWKCFSGSSDRHYLDMLLLYNEEDTVNLERLARLTSMWLEKQIRERHFKPGFVT